MRQSEDKKKDGAVHKDKQATNHAVFNSVLMAEDDDVEESMDFFDLFQILHGGM